MVSVRAVLAMVAKFLTVAFRAQRSEMGIDMGIRYISMMRAGKSMEQNVRDLESWSLGLGQCLRLRCTNHADVGATLVEPAPVVFSNWMHTRYHGKCRL